MMATLESMQDAQEKARDILRRFSINPDLVRVDGVSRSGYEQFVLDESGQRTIAKSFDDGRAFQHVDRSWPEDFPLDEFLKLVWLGWGVSA